MLSIGQHCEHCGFKDFLPFTCDKCGKTVCGDHRENHGCTGRSPSPAPHSAPHSATPQAPPSTASLSGPGRTLGKFQRPPPNANATKQSVQSKQTPQQKTQTESALSKLRGLMGTQHRLLPKGLPSVRKVDPLLELKRDAKGDPKVALQDRVYIKVTRPPQKYKDVVSGTEKTRPEKTLALYFAGSTPVGKVRDSAGTALGVRTSELLDGTEKIAANSIIKNYSGRTLVLAV